MALVSREQMYKKRFTKWGFQKNSRGPTTTARNSSMIGSGSRDPPYIVPSLPTLGDDENSVLLLLTSVRTWSESFYKSVQTSRQAFVSNEQSSPAQAREMSLTFKLAIDMLDRGHGNLAGRMIRKAFLLVEEMLNLEGPACSWNMLDIIYHIVASHHLQLCQVLLGHLEALVIRLKPKSHPLQAMVRALRALIKHIPVSTSACVNNSSGDGDITNATRHSIHEFLYIIQRTWTLNAVILFNNFDHRLFQLYVHIHWEACSIEPPPAIIDAAILWFTQKTQKQDSSVDVEPQPYQGLIQITPFKDDRLLQHLFTIPANPLPSLDYDILCMKSISALKENADFVLSRGTSLAGGTTALLRILAGLATGKALEEWWAMEDISGTGGGTITRLSRGQAGIIAIAIRTSMDLYDECDGRDTTTIAVGQIESIVALRNYANGDNDLQAIQEMWRLNDAHVVAGNMRKALEIRQSAVCRLEKQFKDILVDST
ncbi:hypothetical protein LTR62_008258 [Meristemomyces frigidus]|uniref:Clr5 domain-containing protein n=1 Tax=Meristemomyces frigidus TaxID=1508187 RepID=A0AAN7TBA0_9PEZI|nr:hypothetical protein LTR62_008258 [Meristemomyces frigidus]